MWLYSKLVYPVCVWQGQDIFFAFKKEIQDTNLHARITDTAKWWHRRATVDCKLTVGLPAPKLTARALKFDQNTQKV